MSFSASWGCRFCGTIIISKTIYETKDVARAACETIQNEHMPECLRWPSAAGQKIPFEQICACCFRRPGLHAHHAYDNKICQLCHDGKFYEAITTDPPAV